MARYRGPKSKIARKFGEPIFGPDKVFENKNYPPGMHGMLQKEEKNRNTGCNCKKNKKQNIPMEFLEKQFRNLFEKASSAKGITGEVLLQLLESRLDNVVFRMGIAKTRAAARQFVSHKHIAVNGTSS